MPAEIVTSAWCADYEATFDLPGSKKGRTWHVHSDGLTLVCDCPAFRYSAPEPSDRSCKHTARVWTTACFWNPQWYNGGTCKMRPVQRSTRTLPDQACPNCGGPMLAVRIAV